MNILQKLLRKADSWQRAHGVVGFPHAVIKKYGDDEAGYQAALLTYYGFLSLFPLLLVLTTVLSSLASGHPHLRNTIISSTTQYFPALGDQLSAHIGSLHKTGIALAVGIVFTLYGARGVADAFRYGVNHIWRIPRVMRDGFPVSVARSLGIIIVGGLGFVGAAIIAGYPLHAGSGWGFQALSVAIDLVILFWVFLVLIKLSLPVHIGFREVEAGAAAAAIGLVALQKAGVFLLTRQMQHLSTLYSNFALVLGLLFWIYLQAQVLFYALEITSVRANRLWPRSLTGDRLTEADKRAYTHQARKEKQVEQESVDASFRS